MSEASEVSLMEKVRAAGGGAVALSRELSLTGKPLRPQAISQWAQVPAERVLEVERITGISRHELRPDVFGPAVEPLVDGLVAEGVQP